MMTLTTLPKLFWGYALESAARILNMVLTKKFERTPYEIWHGKAPKLCYLRVWGYDALVKQVAPDKLNSRSIKRVPFEQRNNPPQHPRVIYAPILDINYFCYFFDILLNYDPMDDKPMWAADRVVTPTADSGITILETANEFAIKETENDVVHLMMFSLLITGEAKNWLEELNEGTIET
ncbi:hypothetical protein Tco_1160008 [Tanacetum coccineum]